MTRRYTQKNKAGIKGKSTLLSGLEKMKRIRRTSGADQRMGGQSDLEQSLNDMAKWLVAITKCPPRHYGKVWNDEKEVIVRQAQDLYEEMQKFVTYQTQSYMGNNTNKAGPSDRFIPLSRLRWSVASAKWDFTNAAKIGTNPYWNAKANVTRKVKRITNLEDIDKAMRQHDKDMEPKHVTYGPKVTNTIMDWRQANGFK
jgi:hypothetical protein